MNSFLDDFMHMTNFLNWHLILPFQLFLLNPESQKHLRMLEFIFVFYRRISLNKYYDDKYSYATHQKLRKIKMLSIWRSGKWYFFLVTYLPSFYFKFPRNRKNTLFFNFADIYAKIHPYFLNFADTFVPGHSLKKTPFSAFLVTIMRSPWQVEWTGRDSMRPTVRKLCDTLLRNNLNDARTHF